MMKKAREILHLPPLDERGHPLHVIGWREWVSFPQLGIPRLKAKVDTGARSSAIYAIEMNKFRRKGRQMVRFKVPYQQTDHRVIVEAEAEVIDERFVKSSSGHTELRPVIRTYIELVGVCWPIHLTLSNRGKMKFRMLLGREALQGRFMVDAEKSYVAGKPVKLKRAPFSKNGDDS
jgi:hypothetical protein